MVNSVRQSLSASVTCASQNFKIIRGDSPHAPMAQLDRATVCGTVGRRFESSWAHHFFSERWPRGRRRLTRNQLYLMGTVGSNPTLSSSVTLDLNCRDVSGQRVIFWQVSKVYLLPAEVLRPGWGAG